MIIYDLSFLIRGIQIIEIGYFSFYTSFLGRLYHLIYSRVISILSLDPSALAWVGSHYGPSFFIGSPPTPFIKRMFGPAPLDLCSGPMYMSFSTPIKRKILVSKLII